MYFVEGSGPLLSLQKVKQTLRRLRWHQQHHSDTSHRKGRQLGQQILSDLCGFIKGDNSEGGKRGSPDCAGNVSYLAMFEAMKLQQRRAEVTIF